MEEGLETALVPGLCDTQCMACKEKNSQGLAVPSRFPSLVGLPCEDTEAQKKGGDGVCTRVWQMVSEMKDMKLNLRIY